MELTTDWVDRAEIERTLKGFNITARGATPGRNSPPISLYPLWLKQLVEISVSQWFDLLTFKRSVL